MFPKYSLAVLFAMLSISSVCANEAKPERYPACPDTPVQVGKEDYQPSNLSLQGLTGIYINLDDVISSAKPKNLKLQADLKDAVVKRLEKAGMRLLSKEELEKTPGQPEMSMFPSYPKHLGPFKPGEPRIEYNAQCCTAGIWTSFTQGASTLRNPLLNHKLGTWGEGHNTTDCSDVGKWLNEVVLKTVDNFIAAKQKADQDYKAWQAKQGKSAANAAASAPEKMADKLPDQPVAAPVAAKPVEIRSTSDTAALACDTAVLLYAELFPGGSATLSRGKMGILSKVADNMKACPQYRYRIETHSDQRADDEYNEVLSARRAVAIRNYLVDHGVDEEQFELRFYGERKPLVEGNDAAAWAANRRVMVTPVKGKAAAY
ncbi:MAG TPA: OmpA family protein [Candidatus Thiothrix moscowensis]|uniref:OmpA family protein n=1 Tax=unclassified Thiothrix TaxID=2636184 RepID=UPI0025D536E6|nr:MULTISPECIES: OmpA family protein [unclassified Thiothrix]HRJ51744.1 OmpA family protein [Candidatus Thiothrix moscowensis]HRJ92059.1 OmpA family protein [Candidatus Thiothrix moscowensis]